MNSIRGVLVTSFVVILMMNECACGNEEVAPLHLVDASAAVCLEIPRFEATWTKWQGSQLLVRLKEFPPVQRFLAGAGFQKWTLIDEYARQATGKTVTSHLVGVFSEAVVIAIYLPDGKPPQGVLIAQAREAESLKQALQAWAKLEPQHVSRALVHRGQPYVRRAKSADSTEVVYYTIFGRTIALSDQERLITQVIEFHEAARAKGTRDINASQVLGESTLFQTNRARLPANSAAFLFLNPRMWDPVIGNTLRQSPDAAWIRPIVQSLSAIAASLRLEDEVVVDLVAEVSQPAVPSDWKLLVSSTGSEIEWSTRIPASATAAISSRLDVTTLVHAWLDSTAANSPDDFLRGLNLLKSVLLGRDLFSDVVPLTLRDWTITLIATDDVSVGQSPVNLLGQFVLDGERTSAAVPIERSIDNGIQFAMTALGAMLSHQRGVNHDPLVMVETEVSRDSIMRSLVGIKTWSPAYRVSSSLLTVATSRAMLSVVPDVSVNPNVREKSRLSDFERRYFHSASQLAWLDATRLRDLLGRHRDWIARHVDQDSTEGHDRALKHLSKVEEVIKIFDAAFIAAELKEDHAHFVFGAALDRTE